MTVLTYAAVCKIKRLTLYQMEVIAPLYDMSTECSYGIFFIEASNEVSPLIGALKECLMGFLHRWFPYVEYRKG